MSEKDNKKDTKVEKKDFRTGLSKEELRAELSRRVEERLSSLGFDERLDEQFSMHLARERAAAEKERLERISRREKRKRRAEREARKAEELRARLEEEGLSPDAEEEELSAAAPAEEPLEGQINMADISQNTWQEGLQNMAGKVLGRDSIVGEKAAEIMSAVQEALSDPSTVVSERPTKSSMLEVWRDFKARERFWGNQAENAVKRMDERIDERMERVENSLSGFAHGIFEALHWAEQHKIILLKYLSVVFISMVATFSIFANLTAFEYSYGGKALGIVQNEEDVVKIVDLVSGELSKKYGTEVSIDAKKDIGFKRVFSLGLDKDSTEEVLEKLTFMQDISALACGIYVDGVRVAIVDNEESAKGILDSYKAAYVSEFPGEYLGVDFAENVELRTINTTLGMISDANAVLERLLKDGFNAGEGKTPIISVQTVEIESETIFIPYETVYEKTASLYTDEQRVKQEGKEGEREIVARVVRNNGETMATIEISSEIKFMPTNKIILQGTKALPPLQGTGRFKYPVSGFRISSGFGMRWGRMHYGLDLACSYGTAIRASDGGTVIFSGYSGSYGNVVKIDHGGGFVTVYAHASKLLVSKGQRVQQGDHIANVGSTGRSTGPHCHFEIQKNGVQVNPLNYL